MQSSKNLSHKYFNDLIKKKATLRGLFYCYNYIDLVLTANTMKHRNHMIYFLAGIVKSQ